MVSFNGVAGNFNNYTVDGGNNNNAFFAQQIGRTSIPFQFSEDVIREFQVTSTGFEAEFGQCWRRPGKYRNQERHEPVHGDGYYYILDSATNANDKINNSRAFPTSQSPATVWRHRGRTYQARPPVLLLNYEGQVRNEPLTVNDAPALVNDCRPNFFHNNPDLAAQVQAAAGSFPRSFNQNTAFGKSPASSTTRTRSVPPITISGSAARTDISIRLRQPGTACR